MGPSDGESTATELRACWRLQEKIYASKWTSGRIKVLSNMEENEKKF